MSIINKSSIYGSLSKNINLLKSNILDEESALYLSPCSFEHSVDFPSNNSFCPAKVDWSLYSEVVMQFSPLGNGTGSLDYIVKIPNAGDYVFCLKISKNAGFSVVNNVVARYTSSAAFDPSFSSVDFNDFGGREGGYLASFESPNVSLELKQDSADSVWACIDFTSIVPSDYKFSFVFASENFELLPNVKSNLFIEAVVVCKKFELDESKLFLANGAYMESAKLKIFRELSIPTSHVLSYSNFKIKKSEYGAKIFVKVLEEIKGDDTSHYIDTFRWFCYNIEDFEGNDRKVFSLINSYLYFSEDEKYKFVFLMLEDYLPVVYNFSYSIDKSSGSGKTFIVNSNGGLDISEFTLSFDLYEKDSKIEQIGVQLDSIIPRQLNRIVIAPPEGKEIEFNDLSDSRIRVSLKDNFALKEDNIGYYYVLDLPERHQAFIIDHSGSMSWSDSDGERFKVASKAIDYFKELYPGNVSYSITTFKGTPIIVNWFGAVESEISDTNDPDEVRKAFLLGKFTNFAGVHIVRKQNSAPSSPTDGEIVFNGYDQAFYDTGLEEGSIYYYSIYPFDSSNRFGVPSIIKSKTRSNEIVAGIKSLHGNEIIGSGVRRESSSFLILHMDEGNGRKVYDFSGNRINLEIPKNFANSVFWIDESESPNTSPNSDITKGSGLRFTGNNSYAYWEGSFDGRFNGITLAFWINPLDFYNSKMAYLFRLNSDYGNISIKLDHGNIVLFLNNIQIAKIEDSLEDGSWSHVALAINEQFGMLEMYLNGEYVGSQNIQAYSAEIRSTLNSNVNSIYLGGYLDSDSFVGKISELSITSRLKSYEELNNEYNLIPKDNGDRMLVLKWFSTLTSEGHRVLILYKQESGPLRLLDQDISGPANYGQYQGDSSFSYSTQGPPLGRIPQSDLKARICFGDDIGPANANDGFVIYDSYLNGDQNEWTFIDSFSPELDEKQRQKVNIGGYRHFFRIIRINDSGIESPPDDSGLFEYSCKDFEGSSVPEKDVGSVSNLEATPGNRKIKLKWSNVNAKNIDSVIVYYSDEPINSDFLTSENAINYNIYTVFAGKEDSNSFVHFYGRVKDSQRRTSVEGNFGSLFGFISDSEDDLENGKKAYYAVVVRDRYGRIGNPVFIDSTPSSESLDTSIAPEPVIAPRAYGIDFESIGIKWINPVSNSRFFDIEAWLDDNVILYFKVTDIYGRSIDEQDDFSLVLRWNDVLNGIVGFNSNDGLFDNESGNVNLFDVFNKKPIVNNISFNDVVSYSQSKTNDGWTKVVVSTNNAQSSDRNYIDWAYTNASMKIVRENSFGSDPNFSFTTQPIRIWLKHPINLSLRVNDSVLYSPQKIVIDTDVDRFGEAPICSYLDGDGESGIGGEFVLFGCFAGRKRPYAFQVNATYKGAPLPDGSVINLSVFDDKEGVVRSSRVGLYYEIPGGFQGVIGFNPDLGTPRSQVGIDSEIIERTSYPESPLIFPVSVNVPFFNSPDNKRSIAVCQIRTPNSKAFGRVFSTLVVGEFYRSLGFYVCFNSSLYVKLSTSSPQPDGEDVARQYAYAYTIDPDKFTLSEGFNPGSGNFSLESFAKPVPNNTPIFWKLEKLRNAQERPFYSLSQSSFGGGVIDKTSDGISDNVVFGPVSNVVSSIISSGDSVYLIPEEYIITASVSYSGSLASASSPVCIYPQSINPDQVIPAISETSFYFAGKSFGKSDGNIDYIYSDGEDFATFEIINDPRLLLGENNDPRIDDIRAFCKCYNADGTNSGIKDAFLSVIPSNHTIEIFAQKLPDCQSSGISPYIKGKIEILHGNNISIFVDVDGITQISSSESSFDKAVINTEQNNRSLIAVRSNTFIPLKWKYFSKLEADHGPKDPILCNSFYPNLDQIKLEPHLYLSASTSIISGLSERSIFSDGGIASGNPPKMIALMEPLYIELAYILKNGSKLFDNFIDFDGVSEYELVFVTKFGRRPVPDGTVVKFYKCGSASVKLDKEIGYTETREEIGFWSYDKNFNFETSKASFVSVKFGPLSPSTPVFASIFAEINYDKSGSVFRQRVHGVDLFYGGGASFMADSNADNSSSNPTGGGTGSTGINGGFGGLGGSGVDNGDVSGSSDSGGTFGAVGGGSSSSPPGGNPGSSLFPFPEIVSDFQQKISRLFVNSAFTNTCYIFDSLVTDDNFKWRRIADMSLRKAMHSSEFVGGNLYTICGLSGYGSDPSDSLANITVTNANEKWDINTNKWTGMRGPAVSRFGCCSCNDGRYIYLIGGCEPKIGSVKIGGRVQRVPIPRVSRRFEKYDTLTDQWISLDPMPVLDSNENILSINVENDLVTVTGEPNSAFDPLGVAFGKAIIHDSYIVIIGGANIVDNVLNVVKYSDRILVYNTISGSWYVTEKIEESLISEFSRINPVVLIREENGEKRLVISGGSSSVIETEEGQFGDEVFLIENVKKFSLQNCFEIPLSSLTSNNPSVGDLIRADYLFSQLPKARDQVGYHSFEDGRTFLFGGRVFADDSGIGTNATRTSELVYIGNGSRYVVEEQIKPPFGRSAFGCVGDGSRLIFLTGGLTTNQSPGFVRLNISVFGEQTEQLNIETFNVLEKADATVRLDGYSGVDVKIEAYDDEGELLSGNVDIELSGLLAYGDGSEDAEGGTTIGSFQMSRIFNRRRKRKGTRVYPIVISPRVVTCKDGIGYSRLNGRSEDILRSISEIQEILNLNLENDQRLLGSANSLDLVQGKVRFPYRITVIGTVVDDFYFGKTSYTSVNSDEDISNDPFIPEAETNDIIADAGGFGSASLIPPMLPGYAGNGSNGRSPPMPLIGLGPVLTCSVAGVIGPIGDVDIFKFVPEKTGNYIITIEQTGFSDLKPRLRLFGANNSPYIISETGSNEIFFATQGEALGVQEVEFISGIEYYFQVDSYASQENSSDGPEKFVGSYRLRLTLPIVISQNDSQNNGGVTGGGGSGNGNNNSSNNGPFDIINYIPEELRKLVGNTWFDVLRSYYNNYFKLLINNNSFNQQSLELAIQTISGLVLCPFSCPRCSRSSGNTNKSSCESGEFNCFGSDNVGCTVINGNGNLYIPSQSISSSSSSSEISPYDYDPYGNDPYYGFDPYLSITDPFNLPEAGSNEIVYESIEFSSVRILASSIFSSEGSSPLSEGDSPVIQYYSDLDWIPEIETKIFKGESASSGAKNYLRKISQSIPFGSSPIYDSIESCCAIIKDNFDSDSVVKNIILLSDNDENTSKISPLQNIESINSIDGDRKVRLNVFNINTFYPVTISALASRSNISGITPIVNETNGQYFALFDSSFVEEAAEFAFSGSAGSAGVGSLSLDFNFEEEVIVNEVNLVIDKGNADSLSYTAYYGFDGEIFEEVGVFSDGDKPLVINQKCKFLRIRFNSVIDFNKLSSPNDPYDPYGVQDPYAPDTIDVNDLTKIRSVIIGVASSAESYIFSKAIKLDSSPQQCVIHVDWDGPLGSQVYAGVSLIDSGDWKDYSIDSKPIINGSGKVIVPIRSKDKFNIIKENLEQSTAFVFTMPHGPVNVNSKIKIYENSGNLVDENYYEIDRAIGLVRFNSPQINNAYFIEVQEESLIKVGIKVNFGSSKEPVYINKLGFMVNTNQELAAQNINQKPIAIDVRVSPFAIYPYSSISAIYQYVDNEGDVEDAEKRIVKWYKNGIEIVELLNILSFNDLRDPEDATYDFLFTSNYAEIELAGAGQSAEVLAALAGERMFEPGDQLYFTIQVHDGSQYSNVFRSRTVTISDYPLVPGSLTIRSRFAPESSSTLGSAGQSGGSSLPSIGSIANEFTNRTDLFADFDLFNSQAFQAARLEWWVIDNNNNNSMFKSGRISVPSDFAYTLSPVEKNLISNFEAVRIGHQIYAKLIIPANVVPQITSNVVIQSNTVEIVNIPPVCISARIDSIIEIGNGAQYYRMSYTISDPDITQNDVIPGTVSLQSDQSILRMWKKSPSDEDFVIDPRFGTDIDLKSDAFVAKDLFEINTQFYGEVLPFDGVAFGASVKTDIYTVS